MPNSNVKTTHTQVSTTLNRHAKTKQQPESQRDNKMTASHFNPPQAGQSGNVALAGVCLFLFAGLFKRYLFPQPNVEERNINLAKKNN